MTMTRFSALAAAMAASLLAAGCEQAQTDATGAYAFDAQTAAKFAGAKVASTQVGEPFMLGDCVARAHRIAFGGVGFSPITAVTADCPTATVASQSADAKSPIGSVQLHRKSRP